MAYVRALVNVNKDMNQLREQKVKNVKQLREQKVKV